MASITLAAANQNQPITCYRRQNAVGTKRFDNNFNFRLSADHQRNEGEDEQHHYVRERNEPTRRVAEVTLMRNQRRNTEYGHKAIYTRL